MEDSVYASKQIRQRKTAANDLKNSLPYDYLDTEIKALFKEYWHNDYKIIAEDLQINHYRLFQIIVRGRSVSILRYGELKRCLDWMNLKIEFRIVPK